MIWRCSENVSHSSSRRRLADARLTSGDLAGFRRSVKSTLSEVKCTDTHLPEKHCSTSAERWMERRVRALREVGGWSRGENGKWRRLSLCFLPSIHRLPEVQTRFRLTDLHVETDAHSRSWKCHTCSPQVFSMSWNISDVAEGNVLSLFIVYFVYSR